MKYLPHKTLLFFVLLFCPVFGQAQDPESGKPIKEYFEEVIKEAGNYKSYEVVPRDLMFGLRDSTLKKIADLKAEIEGNKQTTESLNQELSGLNAKLSAVEAELKTANQEKGSISFFGAPTEKSVYKGIMWGIIVILGLLLGLFAYKFKNSDVLTKEAQKNQAETEAEFEEFRQKALEKQQEMGRKLQDERNKRNKAG